MWHYFCFNLGVFNADINFGMEMKSLFACLFVCFFSSSVIADVITFDTQPEQYFVSSVVEGDYVFKNDFDGFGTNNSSLWPTNGSQHLMSWTNNGSSSGFTLTSLAGLFNIKSFDFAGGYVDGGRPVFTLKVTGWLGGSLINSYIFQSGTDFFNATSYTTLSTIFTGIDSFKVEAIGNLNRASFDNFLVNTETNPVPEPVSIALLGLGLAGIRLSRWKAKA